jgi:hypothetical protein
LPVSRVPEAYLADNKAEIDAGTMGASPEDRSSVYGWLTFRWVYPLIKCVKGSGPLDRQALPSS